MSVPSISRDEIASSMLPITLISTSGLFGLAFYNRLIIIIQRLRSLNREMLIENDRVGCARPNRILMIGNQIKSLNCAAKTMRFSIIFVLSGAMSTLVNSLVITIDQKNVYEIARGFHITSLCLILISFMLACGEMAFSLCHVITEEKHIIKEISDGNLVSMTTKFNP
jgi:hypothetical protein